VFEGSPAGVLRRGSGSSRCISAVSPGSLHQFLWLHVKHGRDLLDSHIIEVVAWPESEEDVAIVFVPQLQVLVLARDDGVAVALQKSSHFASANRRDREALLFAHQT